MNIRNLPPFSQLMLLVGMMLLAWVAATLCAYALATTGLDLSQRPVQLLLQAVTQLLVFLLPAWLIAKLCGGELLVWHIDRHSWGSLLTGIVATILLMPAVDWLTVWNDSWHWSGSMAAVEQTLRDSSARVSELTERLMLMDSGWDLLVTLLAVACIPALCEELLFRGVVQPLFQRWWGNVHLAIWTTALLFSLLHGDPFALMPRWLLGVLLGYLFYGSGSLLVNIGVHCFNNAVVVVVYYLHQHDIVSLHPNESLGIGLPLTTACTLAAILLILLVVRRALPKERP